MLRSMTGFAAVTAQTEGAAVTVTLKSVNHRFHDLHLRIPPEVEPLEPRLRQTLRDLLGRGHVDITIAVERAAGVAVKFDRALVRGYLEAFVQLGQEFSVPVVPDVNALLRIPGAMTVTPSSAGNGLETLLFRAVEEACGKLQQMRATEGAALEAELHSRASDLNKIASRLEELRDSASRYCFERLRARVTELLGSANIDRERVAQEAALLAERSDIAEEVVRLKTHVQQFLDTLAHPPPGEAGKRLDFLLQEMNRESNTILSKTSGLGDAGLEITDLGIQAKSEIEKLREQVQNLQ